MAEIAHLDYTVVPVTTSKEKSRFKRAWYAIWKEEGYAVDNDSIVEKYSKYDPHSFDYILLNKSLNDVGTLRIINHSPSCGLPVLNDFELDHHFQGHEKLIEATLLTVHKTERKKSPIPTYLLLITLWRFARANHMTSIVIAADFRLWLMLTQRLGLCFVQMGKEKMYEGSMTVPGYLIVEKQKELAMNITPKNMFELALQEI